MEILEDFRLRLPLLDCEACTQYTCFPLSQMSGFFFCSSVNYLRADYHAFVGLGWLTAASLLRARGFIFELAFTVHTLYEGDRCASQAVPVVLLCHDETLSSKIVLV